MGPPLRNNGESFDSWKQFAAWWVSDKGVSTVILIAIAAGIWLGGPGLVRELRAMHAEQESSHKAVMAEMGARWERVTDRMEASHDRDRDAFTAAIRMRGKDGT